MRWGCFFFLSALTLRAADFEPDFLKEMKIEQKDDGFELKTSIDVPFSFAHSQSRIGVASGNYVDIASNISSVLSHQKGQHSSALALYWAEGFSTSPSSDGTWDKSIDILRLEGRYLYKTLPWLSLLAHARAETSVFKSMVRHDELKTYQFRAADDSVKNTTAKLKELELAKPFSIILVQENFGALANIFTSESFNAETKTGPSIRQNFASGQKVLVKEDESSVVVRDLRNVYQFGYLVGATIFGKLWEEKVAYRAGIDVTSPFWQTPKSSKNFGDSLIIEASAGVALKITSFSSLKYDYTAVRLPEILEDFQQNHVVNLNINFDWLYSFGS